jgi:hypothetical protein
MAISDKRSYVLDAPAFAEDVLDFHPDPVQRRLLASNPSRCILNCTRQWGKSTVTAIKALHRALHRPGSLVIILSPSERQSGEFIHKVTGLSITAGLKLKGDGKNSISLRFPNKSRIVGLPSREDTVRGFSGVSLLLIDEASRVPDELYRTVRPMIAVSGGDLWLISTPAGRRGFFYETWISSDPAWTRISVPATKCPRIPASFLESERQALGKRTFAQEYLCEFHSQDGQLISQEDLDRALCPDIQPIIIPAQPVVTPLPFIKPKDVVEYSKPLPDKFIQSKRYVASDFGQCHDHSSIAIVEKSAWYTGPVSHVDFSRRIEERYSVSFLERFNLGTPYLAVIERISQVVRRLGLDALVEFAADATGAGLPLVELIKRQNLRCNFRPIVITSGDSESRDGDFFHVPKSHLLTALVLQFEEGRLRIASDLQHAETLVQELAGLRIKVSRAGNDLFVHQHGEHDDLVLAVALANWQAMKDKWYLPAKFIENPRF